MSYDRILSIQSLSEVPNPWKGFTMNRCVVLALVIVIVSSSVNEFHEALESFYEETDLGIMSFVGSVQDGSIMGSMWDRLMWYWGSEELGVIRRRKKPIDTKRILKPRTKE